MDSGIYWPQRLTEIAQLVEDSADPFKARRLQLSHVLEAARDLRTLAEAKDRVGRTQEPQRPEEARFWEMSYIAAMGQQPPILFYKPKEESLKDLNIQPGRIVQSEVADVSTVITPATVADAALEEWRKRWGSK